MLIDLIVAAALLLFGAYLVCWLRSASLRRRIERPKHAFLRQAREFDHQDGSPS